MLSSLQNRRNFLRISGEQRRKRGERELRAILPSHATRASHSPRFRLCSPEIRKKSRLFCRLGAQKNSTVVVISLLKSNHPLPPQESRNSSPLNKIKDLYKYKIERTHEKKKITAFNRTIYQFTRAVCNGVEFHVIKCRAESDAPKTVKYFWYIRLPMTINMSFYVYSVPIVLQTNG